MRKLKAYMIYDVSEEAAFLVFHYTAREAKKIAWPTARDSICDNYIDMRVRIIRNAPWLFEEMKSDKPQVIESPRSCNICEKWGHSRILQSGMCENCLNLITGGDYD
jgi:hypothetical protein